MSSVFPGGPGIGSRILRTSGQYALPVLFSGSGEIAYELVEIGGGVGTGAGAQVLPAPRATAAVNAERGPAGHR